MTSMLGFKACLEIKSVILNDFYDYVKHVKVCNVINEGLCMYRTQNKLNGDWVKGVLTCTNTLEWISKAELCKNGVWGEYSLWIAMKCSLATSLPPKRFLW